MELCKLSEISLEDKEGGNNKPPSTTQSSGPSPASMSEGCVTVTEESAEQLYTEYFRPLYEDYCRKLGNENSEDVASFAVNDKLMKNLFYFIWGPDVFKTPKPMLSRLYNELSVIDDVTIQQSDLEDLMCYRPTELLAVKFNKMVIALALVKPDLVSENYKAITDLMSSHLSTVDDNSREAYQFLLDNIGILYYTLTKRQLSKDLDSDTVKRIPDYKTLSENSKFVLMGLSTLFMKLFRVKQRERLDRLRTVQKQIPANVEWALYVSESLRLKRRDALRGGKRPSAEEIEMLKFTLTLEPQNPFVRLNLIDSIIDAVRECNGRFYCGDISLSDMDSAMRFLQNKSRQLCEEFPNNVIITSSIADYFSRYVTYVYFDKEFSAKLLNHAYHLNPENWKTAHRLGILHRMNMRNVPESLKWIERTLELHPFYFNANIDYIRTLFGMTKEMPLHQIAQLMSEKLSQADEWKYFEKAEFKFYLGIAYFAAGETEEALQQLEEVLKTNETLFDLSDLDTNSSIYGWNEKEISSESLRGWMFQEYKNIESTGDSTGTAIRENRKGNIEKMTHLMLGVINPSKPEYMAPPNSYAV